LKYLHPSEIETITENNLGTKMQYSPMFFTEPKI
jgi:hypothetical protein